jgi:hypothetical protein
VADELPRRFFRGLDAGLDAPRAFRRAFADLDAAIRSPECGTTVVACYLCEGMLTVAHVGDSRLVLVGPREARALTRDHRVDDPAKRPAYSGSRWAHPGSVRHAGWSGPHGDPRAR